MKTNRLFNTPFEMEMRILMLLNSTPKQHFTLERILCLDFITCYAGDYGFSYDNLHGDNSYKQSEVVGRRQLIQLAIKELVCRGLIDVYLENGYSFSISKNGKRFISKIDDDYAEEYKEISKEVIKRYRKQSDISILEVLRNDSLKGRKNVLY